MSMPTGGWTIVSKAFLSVAIAFYMAATVLILLPGGCPPRERLLTPIYKYVAGLGLAQTYAVFAPYAPETNTVLTATVTMRDGSTAVWMFPRMEQLGLLERIKEERWRKWWHDNLIPDRYSYLRPDAARFVARRFTDQVNPPVLVSLQCHSVPIPPPPGVEVRRKRRPESKTIYVYQVGPEDRQ
ncbi:MAG TPA: hypothetical protein V6D08_10460 [Candidatus Obscuribacterales bacterium]